MPKLQLNKEAVNFLAIFDHLPASQCIEACRLGKRPTGCESDAIVSGVLTRLGRLSFLPNIVTERLNQAYYETPPQSFPCCGRRDAFHVMHDARNFAIGRSAGILLFQTSPRGQ
jgi:hypothetical protein